MDELERMKIELKSALKNDPNSELTQEPYEVIEELRNMLESIEFEDDDMLQIFDLGLG
jgi:hypothetical protein